VCSSAVRVHYAPHQVIRPNLRKEPARKNKESSQSPEIEDEETAIERGRKTKIGGSQKYRTSAISESDQRLIFL
jgi:hypothetical protein